jgi:2-hydroxy-3-keto-5-methylthiopentenyl-1-phosphate phosphatase
MSWTVLCDFDGTVATVDVTDSLLTAFAPPAWRTIEVEWEAGRISARECMARQIALLDADFPALDRHLREIDIDPQFSAFVTDCAAVGAALVVVSDGIDFAIRRILSIHGLAHVPVHANQLMVESTGRLALGFPHARAGCPQGTCKCASVAREGAWNRRLLIGDGASDFCGARSADLVLAKHRLLEFCRTNHLPHLPFTDFAEVRTRFAEILAATDAGCGARQLDVPSFAV